MKQQLTNLPTLPTGIRVRKVRGQKALALKFIAPKVEEVEVAEVVSPAYTQAAKELEAAVAVLEEVFEPVVRTVRRPIATPTSAPAAAFIVAAKIYGKPLPQAPKVDYSQKGTLGGNKGFSLL
jgi:hypothetical protein